MINPYRVILKPIITEKSTGLQERQSKYSFKVAPDANKEEIKQAIEAIFKVKVKKVNTMNLPGKRKRVRFKVGYTSSWKKAIVTLKEGEKIELV